MKKSLGFFIVAAMVLLLAINTDLISFGKTYGECMECYTMYYPDQDGECTNKNLGQNYMKCDFKIFNEDCERNGMISSCYWDYNYCEVVQEEGDPIIRCFQPPVNH